MNYIDKLLYGCAYYAEYMPEDRLETDMQMLEDAGMNVIRIGESTWSTWEKEDNNFDFSILIRMIEAAARHNIQVIVGTPTYAIPAWLANKHPEVLIKTSTGPSSYGPRQNINIANKTFRFYAGRIIRKMMEAVSSYENVIGFQIDNETHHQHLLNEDVQEMFGEYLKEKFHGDLQALNQAFGLDYWSNRMDDWNEIPDMKECINASLRACYDTFCSHLITDFFEFQKEIIQPYLQPDQFLTHNFDFGWKGYSFGIHPEVLDFETARVLDIAGCDIYHPSRSKLTGAEITFCGSLMWSLKRKNYLVLETQAQGTPDVMPWKGQLRLCAFANLACGADMVEYWHYHSIHNSKESYMMGLLGHDFQITPGYLEAKQTGWEMQRLSSRLVHLKKQPKAAVLVSWESQKGLEFFPPDSAEDLGFNNYNEILRQYCDCLYELNIEYCMLDSSLENLEVYELLVIPACYAMPDAASRKISQYIHNGGKVILSYKTARADEDLKIYHDGFPHGLQKAAGLSASLFVNPEEEDEVLWNDGTRCPAKQVMELLETDEDTQILGRYASDHYNQYAAASIHSFGNGEAMYIGCGLPKEKLRELIQYFIKAETDIDMHDTFPIVRKGGINQFGNRIEYIMNFSDQKRFWKSNLSGIDILHGKQVQPDEEYELNRWDLMIIEY